ncbi:MAG: hypothetical protein ACRBBR_06640 [Cellvibrionaceae bacterium]
MKTKDKDRVIQAPSMTVVNSTSFQNRLAMTLKSLPEKHSRRQFVIEVPRAIINFKGKILLPNGCVYPRLEVDRIMGHESGRQISMFLEMKEGELRYRPKTLTYPRLQALYLYVAIKWPHIAEHIVK